MKIVLLILTTILLVNCKSEKKENDLTENNLLGNVKSVRETSYIAINKFEEIVKGKRGREYSNITDYFQIFNTNGSEIERNNYDKYGGGAKYKYP